MFQQVFVDLKFSSQQGSSARPRFPDIKDDAFGRCVVGEEVIEKIVKNG